MFEELIAAIISAESAGNSAAVSPKGAMGLMQIMPATFEEWAKNEGLEHPDPFDPADNKKVGTAYFKFLLNRYEQNIALAVAAYNWGLGHIDKLYKSLGALATMDDIEPFVPHETKRYLAKVLGALDGKA